MLLMLSYTPLLYSIKLYKPPTLYMFSLYELPLKRLIQDPWAATNNYSDQSEIIYSIYWSWSSFKVTENSE